MALMPELGKVNNKVAAAIVGNVPTSNKAVASKVMPKLVAAVRDYEAFFTWLQ